MKHDSTYSDQEWLQDEFEPLKATTLPGPLPARVLGGDLMPLRSFYGLSVDGRRRIIRLYIQKQWIPA